MPIDLNISSHKETGFSNANTDFNNQILSIYNAPVKTNKDYVNKSAKKTGTTICGLITAEGVVLAADTRATAGTFIADKNCFKLHKITDSIWCAGAGVAADLHHLTELLAAKIKLLSYALGFMPPVETCVEHLCSHLVKHNGEIIVALIIGGVNADGTTSLWYVSPNGYSHSLPYIAMGSGGYFAQTMLETYYHKGLSLKDGQELAADAIQAGILNDLGSGSNVDLVTISLIDPTHAVLHRPYRSPVAHQKIPFSNYEPRLLQAKVVKETITPIKPFCKNSFSSYISC